MTAESFIRGMTRAADGRSESEVAYHLAGIAGYDELHGTEDNPASTTTVFAGLSAPDADTLVVRLSVPDCEFDKKTIHPVFSPVPQQAKIPAVDDGFGDQPIGNGPFQLDGPWRHDEGITLVRNDAYGGDRPAIGRVTLKILPPKDALEREYREFRAGNLDFSFVPPALVPEARAAYEPGGGFIAHTGFEILYLAPENHNPPLDNVDARKAVSYAIDRPTIMTEVFEGAQKAATSFIPPPFKVYHQPGVCGACTFDPVRAKDHAASGGLHPGDPINLHYPEGVGDEAPMRAVADQLKANLGLQVNLVALPMEEFHERWSSDQANGLFSNGWFADYPTPDNFLFPLLSSQSLPPGDNDARYTNAAFDSLLAQARATRSPDERVQLLKQAEALAIGDDLALIPFYYATQIRVFDAERWEGLHLNFFSDPNLETVRPR